MNQEKIDKKTQTKLFSTNKTTVITAIHKISAQGNKLYLPVLFDLLLSNIDEEIKTEIIKLLGNIKVKVDKRKISHVIQKLKKINELLKDISRTPFTGLGKPEPLKHKYKGFWSRRIDKVN